MDMKDTDVALRCNIVTLSEEEDVYEERTIIDHSSDEISTEDAKILLDAVRALGDPDGKILLLKYYFGYPSKKIAAVYGLQENTVNQKIRRSLAKVKAILEGGVCYEA